MALSSVRQFTSLLAQGVYKAARKLCCSREEKAIRATVKAYALLSRHTLYCQGIRSAVEVKKPTVLSGLYANDLLHQLQDVEDGLPDATTRGPVPHPP